MWRKTLDRLIIRGWVDANKKPTAEGLAIIQTQMQAISPMIDSDRYVVEMSKRRKRTAMYNNVKIYSLGNRIKQ